ncbi:hypothetical protein [Gimesia fumaroli]|uniref:Uncharacterized protein n=1 Tax=Gimesia fumaroli TaxID=2527976 RepID=A0A518IIE8_9PLAN|nr:hypothetical protein [Gimesia fumaroli]QDV52866.1 hypothetical protein Enr17x_49360 [Gimesia fumaroli]
MNFLIAGFVAATLILGMFLFIKIIDYEFRKFIQDLGGKWEPDYGMEFPGGTLIWISIANLLRNYRVLFSILILCICFGIAFFCGSSGETVDPETRAVSETQSN